MIRDWKVKKKMFFCFGVILLICGLSLPMFFGFYDQVESTDYPKEWYEAKEWLDGKEALILPWHMYMDISWLENRDKRCGNPGCVFFENAICGDNIEIGNISTQSTLERSVLIGEIVKGRFGDYEKIIQLEEEYEIEYIVLLKEVDYDRYKERFDELAYFELVFENEKVLVYEFY